MQATQSRPQGTENRCRCTRIFVMLGWSSNYMQTHALVFMLRYRSSLTWWRRSRQSGMLESNLQSDDIEPFDFGHMHAGSMCMVAQSSAHSIGQNLHDVSWTCQPTARRHHTLIRAEGICIVCDIAGSSCGACWSSRWWWGRAPSCAASCASRHTAGRATTCT